MKRACHLMVADEPQRAGRDYKALCPKEVYRAGFVIEYDGYERNVQSALASIKGLCDKCKAAYVAAERKDHHYLYVILDGEFLKEPEEAA